MKLYVILTVHSLIQRMNVHYGLMGKDHNDFKLGLKHKIVFDHYNYPNSLI